MKVLEPIHDQCIDLLVAGLSQTDAAAVLGLNPRTLRRWAESDIFVAELARQHQLARKLQQDAAAELARKDRELRDIGRQRIRDILEDRGAPSPLLLGCLKHLQKEELSDKRLDQAQRWSEFVYADRKQERLAKLEGEQKIYAEHLQRWTDGRIQSEAAALLRQRQEALLRELKASGNSDEVADEINALEPDPYEPCQCGPDEECDLCNPPLKADKSGQQPNLSVPAVPKPGAQVPSQAPDAPQPATVETPDKSGHLRTSLAADSSEPAKKADKSGHLPRKISPEQKAAYARHARTIRLIAARHAAKPFQYPATERA